MNAVTADKRQEDFIYIVKRNFLFLFFFYNIYFFYLIFFENPSINWCLYIFLHGMPKASHNALWHG